LEGARLERSNRQLKARNDDSSYCIDHTLEAVAAPSKAMNEVLGEGEILAMLLLLCDNRSNREEMQYGSLR